MSKMVNESINAFVRRDEKLAHQVIDSDDQVDGLFRKVKAELVETVQSAPFVKPHCVLIVASATVLLMNGRSAHTDVRLQKHASGHCMAELLLQFLFLTGISEILFFL